MQYSRRRKICEILDVGGEWKLLAAEIGLSVDKIQHLELSFCRIGGSATSDLLTIWSQSNASIEMFASLLLRLKLQRAAEVLRGLVPDSMFDTESCDNSTSKNSGAEPPMPRLPKPSQMNDEADLPLPCFPSSNKAMDYRQQQGVLCQNNGEKQKMNIALQHSDSLKNGQKPASAHVRPLETWLENMTPDFEFFPPSHHGKPSKELQSSDSEVFRRLPEETLDVASVPSSISAAKKSSLIQKSADPDGAVALSKFVIFYHYVDIVTATNSFHEDNLLGCGGFGSVYRGNIKKTTFAIKVLHKRQNPTTCRDFLAEINSLLKFRQKNIIMLSGCSVDGPIPCLVYEYMVNGSLQDRLECKNNTKPLSWSIRHGVLKDAAAGLQYLHTVDEKPLIHGDIKSANILLGAHYEAKISDFGLAKEATGGTIAGKYTHITRNDFDKVYGSRAYLPEEFFTGGYQFNIKTDTYSFGIVIFETCTGEKPDDPRREGGKLLAEYVKNITDSKSQWNVLKDKKSLDWPDDLWMEVIVLGQSCTSDSKKKRPHMTEVYGKLENLHQEMQLKGKSVKVQMSNDGSMSCNSGSERSHHLSHQGSATHNQSLAAENSMPLETASFEFQNTLDTKNQYGQLAKDKFLPSIQGHKLLQEDTENLSELSIADDGSKKQSALSKARHPAQQILSHENQEKVPYASKQVGTTISSNLKPGDNYNWSNVLQESNFFIDSKPVKICPSECKQNYENEQKEVGMDNTAGNMFLQWKRELQIKGSTENTSNPGSYQNSMVLSEELMKMKNKKFPDFFESYSSDTSFNDATSVELEQMKKKNLPGYANIDDHEHCPTNMKQNGTKNYSSSLDLDKNCFLPQCHFLQSKNFETFCGMAEIQLPCQEFVPPEPLEYSESFSSLDDKDDTKCMFVAKEDLMRAEKLERLKRLRYEEN